ncbi:hypothetical protein FACS189472_01310 [Alphaproteobacteria bacterium]|nr:hypothetical protein FACS189472_01310 [Alphaproteobacteria bacterium]
MKRILISGCLSAIFLVTCGEMEATQAQASSATPLKRTKSNARLDGLPALDKDKSFSAKEYEQLREAFYKQNIFKQPKVTVSEIDLYRLGKVLGFKEYKIKGAEGKPGIPTIDLSWPNIRQVFLEKIGNNNPNSRAREFADLIEKTKIRDEYVSADNFSSLGGAEKTEILDLCLAENNGLFDLSELSVVNKGHFRRQLRQMLGDYTGFQRIMSLLAVSILNSISEHAFVRDFTRIGVAKTTEDDEDCYNPTARKIEIEQNSFSSEEYTTEAHGITYSAIFHEITHGYHDMIFGSLDLGNYELAYQILNSEDANFIQVFFPMLANERMETAVEKIVELMSDLDIDDIRKHIKDGKLDNIIHIFRKIVDCGFGNLVFSREGLFSGKDDLDMDEDGLEITKNGLRIEEDDIEIKEDSLNIGDNLTMQMLARAIYVYYYAIQTNATMWTDCEEMLTITGLAPITDGNRTYLFEDRQHEEIHKIRHQENRNWRNFAALDNSEKQAAFRREFRYHAEFSAETVAEGIANMISDICVECMDADDTPGIDAEDIKEIFVEICKKTANSQLPGNNEDDINIDTLFKPGKSRFGSDNTDNMPTEPNGQFSEGIILGLRDAAKKKLGPVPIMLLNKNAGIVNGLLAENKAHINDPCDTAGNTLLHLAVLYGNKELRKSEFNFLDDVPPGIAEPSTMRSPSDLYIDPNETIRVLLDHEADREIRNEVGYTPLELAILSENIEAIKILSEDLDGKDNPLHFAATNGKYNVIKAFGAEIRLDALDDDDHTPLQLAVINNEPKAIKTLLELRAIPDDTDEKGNTLLHLAAEHGSAEAIYAIGEQLHWVPIKDLSADGISEENHQDMVHKRNDKGETPLHNAAALFKKGLQVDALLKYGADPNAVVTGGDNTGMTPLHIAVQKGNSRAIKVLLSYGANPKAVAENGLRKGMTPLHLAAEKRSTRALNALLENMRPIQESATKTVVKDGCYKGMTPLHLAALKGNADAIEALLERITRTRSAFAAVVAEGEYKDKTPVQLAAWKGKVKALTTLLEHIINKKPTLAATEAEKALDLAIQKKNIAVIEAVIDSPATKIETIHQHSTALIGLIGEEKLLDAIKTKDENRRQKRKKRIMARKKEASQPQPDDNT